MQAAGGLSEESLLAAIEEAAEARLVTEVSASRFRFAHALVRTTLYESLTTARQVDLHRKTAEAIETIHARSVDDYLPSLAHHWAKASAPVADVTRAVEYAQRAGDRALAQLANDEAARYYASGLDLLDVGEAEADDPRRLELLIGRGEAQRRAGDEGYNQTLLDAADLARRLGDATGLGRAALANSLGDIWTRTLEVDAGRVKVLEAALAAAADADARLRARLMATLGLELFWHPEADRRLALSAEALAIARTLGDPETLSHVLLARDYTIHFPDNAAERFAATDELLGIADASGDPVLASRALGLRFKAAMELTDVSEAERCLARNQAVVADLGQPALTWATMHHRASLLILRGDPEAEAAADAAYEFGATAGRAFGGSFRYGHHFVPYWHQGRMGELEEFVVQFLDRRADQPFFEGRFRPHSGRHRPERKRCPRIR